MKANRPKILIALFVGFLAGVLVAGLVFRLVAREMVNQVEVASSTNDCMTNLSDIVFLDSVYDKKGLEPAAKELLGGQIDSKVLLFGITFRKIRDEQAINYILTTVRNTAPIFKEVESEYRANRTVQFKDQEVLKQMNASYEVLINPDKVTKG